MGPGTRGMARHVALVLLACAMLLVLGPRIAEAEVCDYPPGWSRTSSPDQYRGLSTGAPNYPRTYVFSVAGDPAVPHGLFAGSYNDLARSPDCGRSWAHFAIGGVAGSITIGPDGLMYMIGAQWLLRSTDAGQTWHNVEQYSGQGRSLGLLLAPSDPTVLYQIGYESSSTRHSYPETRVTLRRLRILPDDDALVHDPWDLMHAARPPGPVLVDPSNADTLYILGETESWTSTDGGRTFAAEPLDPAPARPPFMAARLAPDGSRVWAVDTAHRVLVSFDLGWTWSVRTTLPLGDDVTFVKINDLQVSPFDPDLLFLALHVQPDFYDRVPAAFDRNGIHVYRDAPPRAAGD